MLLEVSTKLVAPTRRRVQSHTRALPATGASQDRSRCGWCQAFNRDAHVSMPVGAHMRLHRVDIPQDLRRDRVLRLAESGQTAAMQHRHMLRPATGQGQVVQHYDDDHSGLAGDVAHMAHHPKLVVHVEGARRLVEQENAGLAHERLRETRELPLAPRQLIERRKRECEDIESPEHGHGALARLLGRSQTCGPPARNADRMLSKTVKATFWGSACGM